MMLGSHVTKCWSSTQASLALSSGEAEYYGVVRAAGIGLGQQALFRDAGLDLGVRIWTDSAAAMGTSGRQGLGKLRHLECHSLWLQQRLRRKAFELRKVQGEKNPADLFTKHLESAQKLKDLVNMFNCSFVEGRPASAPALKRAPKDTSSSTREPSGTLGCPTTETQLLREGVLPHLQATAEMEEHFPAAVPQEEHYGEEDHTPEAELADPVPLLEQHRCGAGTKKVRAVGCHSAGHLGVLLKVTADPTPHTSRAVNSQCAPARSVGGCLGGWCSSYISSSFSSKQASRCAGRWRCTGSPAKVGRQLQVGDDEVDDAQPNIHASRTHDRCLEGGIGSYGFPREPSGTVGSPGLPRSSRQVHELPRESCREGNDGGGSSRLSGAPTSTFGLPRSSTGTRILPSRGLGCRAVDTDGSTGPFLIRGAAQQSKIKDLPD